jgi:hypothetical protein
MPGVDAGHDSEHEHDSGDHRYTYLGSCIAREVAGRSIGG